LEEPVPLWSTAGLPPKVIVYATALNNLVSNYFYGDLFGIKINYHSILNNMDDEQILLAYHPKYIFEHDYKYASTIGRTEGGIKNPLPSPVPLNYNTSTSTTAHTSNSTTTMNDSSNFSDDEISVEKVGTASEPPSLQKLSCLCDCQCVTACFCNTQFCMASIIPRDPDSTPPVDWYESNLEPALKQRFADIILYFHQQRGHPNFRHIIDDFRRGVFDDDPYLQDDIPYLDKLRAISYKIPPSSFVCLTCPGYKIRKANMVRQSNRQLDKPMAKGYIDAIGPFPVGYGDARYVLVYRDEHSNFGLGAILVDNISSEYKPAITAWRLQARDDGWAMEKLHFDAGSIGLDKNFREFLDSLDISQEYAAPGQQWVNSLVERFIGTISKNAKVLLKASALPLHFWPFAYIHSIFLHNTVTRKRFLNSDYDSKYQYMVPYQIVRHKKFGKKLPIFGQLVFARFPDPAKLGILDPAGRRCVFLGIDHAMHDAYILLNLETMRVIKSNDILAIKNLFGYSLKPIISGKPVYISGDTELPSAHQGKTTLADDIDSLPETRVDPRAIMVLPRETITLDEIYQVPGTRIEPALKDTLQSKSRSKPTSQQKTSRKRNSDLPEIMIVPRDPLAVALYCTSVIMTSTQSVLLTHNTAISREGLKQSDKESHLDSVMIFNINTSSRYCPQYSYIDHDLTSATAVLDNYWSHTPNLDHIQQCHALSAHKRVWAEGKWQTLPRNHSESISPEFIDRFGPANTKEIDMILEYECFTKFTVDLPLGKQALGTKYVFDMKTDELGNIEKYKTRLTIQGFLQKHIDHFNKTYAPTAFKESIRLIMYLIHSYGFHQFYFDIKGAFLNGAIDEEIYVKVPAGFPHYNPDIVKYYRLLKALYGTKQAAANFYADLDAVLRKLHYSSTASDPCLWFRITDKGLSLLGTHVDDMPGCSQDPEEVHYLAAALADWYELSNKLVINKLLGMTIHKNIDDSCIMFSDTYIYGLLEELDMSHIKPRSIPGTPRRVFLPNTMGQADPVMHAKYRTIIGSAIFIQCNWRPDIDYTVGRLAEHMHNPSFEHFDAAIDLLRYLKHTATWGIKYSTPSKVSNGPPQLDVLTFFDADWAKESDSKSVSGWVMSFVTPEQVDHFKTTGDIPQNNIARWASKKQADHVADSTESAETVAAVAAAKDMMWIRSLLKEIGLMPEDYRPSILSGDNRSTLISIEDEKVTATNRWSARKTAFVRNAKKVGDLIPWWTPTKKNPADGFTKYLEVAQHTLCFRNYMGEADVPHERHRPKRKSSEIHDD